MFWRKELQDEIAKQRTEIALLKDDQAKWREGTIENQKLHEKNAEITTAINKLNSQVREQTEADLFFASAKICFELFNGKPKEKIKSQLERQQELRMALVAQQQAMPYPALSGLYSPYNRAGLLSGLFRQWL